MHKFLALMSLFVLFVTHVGCERGQKIVTPTHEQKTLKIGFIVTGDRAPYLNAAQLAVDEMNALGGILGTPVDLVSFINTEALTQLSVQTTENMILKDKVTAIIGPNRSTHAVAVGPIAQQYGVPMITTAATNPDVTNAGDFVFMASVTDTFQGKVLAQFAITELNITTAAILTLSGDVYTEGISEFFASNFSDFGGEIVANEFYESGTTDFTAQLTRIADAKPDAFFIASFADEIAPITQHARSIPIQNAEGMPTLFLGADTWDNEVLLADEDAEVEGSFFTTHFSPDTDEPTARAFVNTYKSVYESTPTGGVAVSYDAVKLLFEAIERAGSLDPDEIRQQLAATENYIGATRVANYDENRHPTKSAVILTIKNGQKQFYKQIDP